MAIADFFFPKACLVCNKQGRYICADCLLKVGHAKQMCPVCTKASIDGAVHVRCKKAWGLDGSLSVWNYGGVIRKALLKTKYSYATDIINEIVENVGKHLKENTTALPKQALLVPVPLHVKRERWRGFNQSALIGSCLAKRMSWGFSDDVLVRRVFGKPQVQLKGEERAKNVRGVFVVNQKKLKNVKVVDEVVVFDDVATTGATLKEATKMLKMKGVKKAWGLTVAR